MKKILPVVALIGISTLVVGISHLSPKEKKESFISQINEFRENLNSYSQTSNVVQTAMNKYMLTLESENLTDMDKIQTLEEAAGDINSNNENIQNDSSLNLKSDEINPSHLTKDIQEEDLFDQSSNEEDLFDQSSNNDEVLTLYFLSNDIENSCDDFCNLKTEISKAIIETQNLIEKVQKKELELSNEQRLYITEQAQQLKNLGRQLANITTELSFSLSDINNIMLTDNLDFNNLSMKYLIVLDNLVNGNEMLQSGLTSLNLINQMFNMNSTSIPPNNKGRILYGFQQNNNEPIIKDYLINNNGELIENKQNNSTNENTSENNEQVDLIDSYKENKLKSNIDTYNTNNLPTNIDSFFNTALLDNKFMYGKGYGNNLGYNPYINGYLNQNQINGMDHDNISNNNENENDDKKTRKKLQLKKNIDTFKDENEPDIKTKLGNIKNSISAFFGLNDKIDKPISRFNPNEKN